MQLTSTAFKSGDKIPSRYTCEGTNVSPEFSWTGSPAEAKAFALIMHDPDAARPGGFTHWVLYNIPADTFRIPDAVPTQKAIAEIGTQGQNDAGKIGYTGPCPPSGTHRYVVRLFALDLILKLPPGAKHEELKDAMKGHILAQAELMGTCAKNGVIAA
ncbi:MAG: YbhB/YbcL family Raf kinase inhibitor-like protein [Terriglobales bacterium]